MTRQEILLNKFNRIKKKWLNAPEGSDEQKTLEDQMDICVKEMKKANSEAVKRSRIDYGANVLSHYLTDTNKAQNGTGIKNKEDNNA